MKHKCTEALHQNRLWDRGQLSKQDLSHWGRRLSSFWGKPLPWWANESRNPQGAVKDRKDKSVKDLMARGEEMRRQFEAVRHELEKDPYMALFGTRMQQIVFNPKAFSFAPLAIIAKTALRIHNAEKSNHSDSVSTAGKSNAAADELPAATSTTNSKPASPASYTNLHYQSVVPESFTSDDGYEIDPITLRKVWPKKPLEQNPHINNQVNDTSVDIPVKAFVGTEEKNRDVEARNVSKAGKTCSKDVVSYSDTGKKSEAGRPQKASSGQNDPPNSAKASASFDEPRTQSANCSPQDSLAQKGFGPRLDPQRTSASSPRQSSGNISTNVDGSPLQGSSIKPTSSRRPHKASLRRTKTAREQLKVLYDANDSKAEDLDLLRSSDVRAASGIIKGPRQETTLERQRRREKLERDFQNDERIDLGKLPGFSSRFLSSSVLASSKLTEEAMPDRVVKSWSKIVDDLGADKGHLIEEDLSIHHVKNQSVITTEMDNIENRVQHQELLHAADLQAQEAAERGPNIAPQNGNVDKLPWQPQAADLIGEGDMSANVSDFANRARWYKIKAPHAYPVVKQLEPQTHSTGWQIEDLIGERDSTLPANAGQFAVTKANAQKVLDSTVVPGLGEYEAKIGSSAYKFEMGHDTLEDDLIKQFKDRPNHIDPLPMARRRADREFEPWVRTDFRRSYAVDLISARLATNDMRLRRVREQLEQIKKNRSFRLSDSQSIPAAIYKILAYDSNTGKMTTADTTSSHGRKEEALSPSSVLLRINRPTKFFPYITSMQADDYEIVSGRDDMLVFQKMRDTAAASPGISRTTELGPIVTQTQPAMSTTQEHCQKGNSGASLSSSDFRTTVFPPPLAHPTPSRSTISSTPTSASHKATREEDVFSAPSRKWQDSTNNNDSKSHSKKSKIRKAARRVLWVGVWTAGCAYAVGVVAEYFRTGGANGLGPQGF